MLLVLLVFLQNVCLKKRALNITVKPDLTHDIFLGYLNSNDLTQDIGAPGKDSQFGYGLIDAHKAVLTVLDTSSPKILSSTNNLFFDVSQITRSFNLIASGVETESDLGSITVALQVANAQLTANAGGAVCTDIGR